MLKWGMTLGKNELKDFALRARNNLIEQVAQRAALFGITWDTMERDEGANPGSQTETNFYGPPEAGEARRTVSVTALRRDVQERGFERVIEDAACIWFNRLVCLWYMEVNGYLPPEKAIFAPQKRSKEQTEIKGSTVIIFLDEERGYKGKSPGDEGEGLFRYKIIRRCEEFSEIMPFLFADSLGYERLLLPDCLIGESSVVRDMVEHLDREDFLDNVQITGWLYQYFISPKKDEVYEGLRKNKKIAKEDIPAATQLFTPDWIVKYMVENSLGRLWLASHPESRLKSGWYYYIEEAEQSVEAAERMPMVAERKLSSEDIKVMDPAMGSGHILVYAFDVMYEIYLSQGYKREQIPALIIENNLYGLDIDDRASSLACFALMMKARSRDKDFLLKGIRPNLYALRESGDLDVGDAMPLAAKGQGLQVQEECTNDLNRLLEAFRDAREFGSVIKLPDMDLERLQGWWEGLGGHKRRYTDGLAIPPIMYNRVSILINKAKALQGKYHVVVTNPPYMGIRGMNSRLADYLNIHYRYSKHDLFTVFMDLALQMTVEGGFLALINQHSWMFLSSYRKFREKFLQQCCICSMLHLGSGVFEGNVGTIVQSTAFVARRVQTKGYRSVFIDLQSCGGSDAKERALLAPDLDCGETKRYTTCVSDLEGIPGRPIAYWAHQRIVRAFADNKKLGDLAKPRQGMATSDNNRFVRYWYEVPFYRIGFGCGDAAKALQSGRRWFPYNKGGAYRKWYGNNSFVVNWEEDGREIKDLAASLYGNHSRTIKNIGHYFREAITYTFISTNLGVRYSPPGFIFDVAGSSIFAPEGDLYILLAFLCSKVSKMFLEVLNPTFNIQVGDIKNLPVVDIKDDTLRDKIVRLSRENIEISRTDWDSKETSWNFKRHPLIEYKEGAGTIEGAYSNWLQQAKGLIERLRRNEEQLNGIFIQLYGLQQSLTPTVEDKDITIRKPDRDEAVKSFISYAVGCMFGRYSPGAEGLISGGGPFHPGKYKGFAVKEDNIIPITDSECFKDNLLSLFISFVGTVFGRENLTQNLEFIARSLGAKQGETAGAAIGRYLEKVFYKDHLSMYNRRPVYWLFHSGRENGFKALVYMHRYKSSTLSVMREKYLRRVIAFYRNELNCKEKPIPGVSGPSEAKRAEKRRETLRKRLDECIVYDRALLRAIREGITINPDDGVINNYIKFQNVLAEGREKGQSIRVNLLAQREF